MVRRAVLLVSAWIIPSLAVAQQPSVPGLNVATASAAVTVNPTAAQIHTQGTPPGLPPPVHTLSPSAPLNAKERASAAAAAAWRNRNERPVRGEDGVLRWPFGASLPSVVCSPLQVCDLALQPGEVVNSIHVGDKVRWTIMPAVSGEGNDRTTHLIIKPSDAGLVTSILIFTDLRTYSVKLISTRTQWTPLTAFSYPETAQAAWANYGVTMGSPVSRGGDAAASGEAALDFDYAISGNASWRPLRVYALKGKTYIQFPSAIRYASAPALVGLANDGGWFSSPSEQMLRYRIVGGDTYMVDGILDHAALVEGVGGGQTRIDIRRQH